MIYTCNEALDTNTLCYSGVILYKDVLFKLVYITLELHVMQLKASYL